MQYLTNYYKNLAENLQKKVDSLEKQLSLLEGKAEMDKGSKTNTPLVEPNVRGLSDTAKAVPATIVVKKVSKEEKEEQDRKNKEMELPEGVIHEIAEVPGQRAPKGNTGVNIPKTGAPLVDEYIKSLAQLYGNRKS